MTGRGAAGQLLATVLSSSSRSAQTAATRPRSYRNTEALRHIASAILGIYSGYASIATLRRQRSDNMSFNDIIDELFD